MWGCFPTAALGVLIMLAGLQVPGHYYCHEEHAVTVNAVSETYVAKEDTMLSTVL